MVEYRQLGSSGLKVSPICLGTMNLGPRTAEKEAFRILDMAFEAGIIFFDTANTYGRRSHKGTEELLGRWLGLHPHRRDKIVMSTKVCGSVGDGANDRGLSAYHLRNACEASLKRLNIDHIDLYQLHHIDRSVPWEETQQALEIMIQQGKIVYCGTSNFPAWMIAKASESLRNHQQFGLVSEQSVYNLSNRAVETEVLPACRHYGMSLLAYSPVGGGLLSGILAKEAATDTRSASFHTQQALAALSEAVRRYEQFCQQADYHPAALALAWLLASPAQPIPVIGPRTTEHLALFIEAMSITLDAETLAELEAIFPGPGGEAPEVYAW